MTADVIKEKRALQLQCPNQEKVFLRFYCVFNRFFYGSGMLENIDAYGILSLKREKRNLLIIYNHASIFYGMRSMVICI